MPRKRKLSQQQQKRIQSRQEQWQADDTAEGHAGTVIAHFGGELLMDSEENGQFPQQRVHARANLGGLVAGDRVVWSEEEAGEGVIVARHERHGELQRPDRFGRLKTIAANVDQLVLVIAPQPAPQPELMDRYLAAAQIHGLDVVILLNKQDLLDGESEPAIESLLNRYRKLNYRIERTSAQDDAPGAEEPTFLNGRISVIAGQSGVGKSSLIQHWLPETSLRTGGLSRHGEGTHTTTTAYLYRLESGGAIIDSPGIREFGLWHVTPDDITEGFVDVRRWIGHCRFRDCHHRNEPGCALKDAVENGELHPERFEHYLRIRDEAERQRPTS